MLFLYRSVIKLESKHASHCEQTKKYCSLEYGRKETLENWLIVAVGESAKRRRNMTSIN